MTIISLLQKTARPIALTICLGGLLLSAYTWVYLRDQIVSWKIEDRQPGGVPSLWALVGYDGWLYVSHGEQVYCANTVSKEKHGAAGFQFAQEFYFASGPPIGWSFGFHLA